MIMQYVQPSRLEKEKHVFSAEPLHHLNGDVCEGCPPTTIASRRSRRTADATSTYRIMPSRRRSRLSPTARHPLLLPTTHPLIRVETRDQKSIEAIFTPRPPLDFHRGDCTCFRYANITASSSQYLWPAPLAAPPPPQRRKHPIARKISWTKTTVSGACGIACCGRRTLLGLCSSSFRVHGTESRVDR